MVKDGNVGIVFLVMGGVLMFLYMMLLVSGNDCLSFVLYMDMGNWCVLNAMLGGTDGCMMSTREDVDEDVFYGVCVKDECYEVIFKCECKCVCVDDNGDIVLGLYDIINYRNVRESFFVLT